VSSKPCRAALDWTVEGGCPHVVRGELKITSAWERNSIHRDNVDEFCQFSSRPKAHIQHLPLITATVFIFLLWVRIAPT
jgi:hypothetical protein